MDYKRAVWEAHHYRFGLAGEGQADVIQHYVESRRSRVLSVGCGSFVEKTNALAKSCDTLIAVDRSTVTRSPISSVTYVSNVAPLCADAYRLPLVSGSCDCIVALGLFAHITDPALVTAELRRACRASGYILLTNAVRHPKERFKKLGRDRGLELIEEHEGHCYAASGDVKRRYLLVFQVPERGHQ